MINCIDISTSYNTEVSKLLILDRDGVINKDDDGYFHNKNNIVYIEKNLNLIKKYIDAGWDLCVATNQSGIGRGYFTEDTFRNLCIIMSKKLEEKGILINRWYFCPHNPDKEICSCRKPSPKMLLAAINYFKPDEAIFMGDKDSDKLAAENANIPFIKV